MAQHTTNRVSAIDGRTTRHASYAVSKQECKRVKEIFGWLKTVELLRKVKLRGVQRVGWLFTLASAAHSHGGHNRSQESRVMRILPPL